MLARTRELTESILDWYERFEFHRVYHAVNDFAVADLSNFYLDVLKDRLYTFAPTSKERRSAQTVLWQITEALVRLVAPILSFTADEVWEYLPAVEGREASVHLAQFPAPAEIFSEDPAPLLEEWKELFAVRNHVLQQLESARQNKAIGKALEAKVVIVCGLEARHLLERYSTADLKEIFNVSAVELRSHFVDQSGQPPYRVEVPADDKYEAFVELASGQKCARCWNFMPEVGNYGIWQNVCTRCSDALKEMKIEPPVETV